MTDYKDMYLTVFRAMEQAVNIIIKAQREAEELYLSSADADLALLKSDLKEKDPPD